MKPAKFNIIKLEKSLIITSVALGIIYLFHDRLLYEEIIGFLRNVYVRLITNIHHLDDGTPLSERFFPFLLTILFLAVVFLYKAPMPRWLRCSVIVYTFFLHTAYIVFRIGTLNFRDPISTFASILLFVTESIHYIGMCFFYLQMAWPVDRSRQADHGEKLVRSDTYTPTVGFFIPTYNEPVDLLRRTLIGCQTVDYPFKNVYLLDDTARPEMRNLAMELGCGYIARSDNTDAKAGNLNNALFQTNEELIAFFDCDNIPVDSFLSRLVGFFYDPKVAMVISSLHYYNAQEPSKNIGIEMLIAADHANSLGNSQTGRDTFNALLCMGTSYIIRRKPLEEIGGIPTETLCEDWATSIKLQARGYKTYFLNEVLSSGMAAENLSEFIQQRLRWCQGTLQSLYVSTNPLRIEGFTLWQRLVHVFGVFYYLMYPVTFIALFIPLLYFFFGVVPIEANLAQFTFFFLPFFVMQNMMYVSFSRRPSSLVSSQIYDFIMCFPLTIVVAKTFIKPFGKAFRVTRKGIISDKITSIPSVGYPMLFMFLLYLGAITFGANNVFWLGVGAPFLVYSLWSIYRMVFFWMSFQAAVNLPQKRRAIRFTHTPECHLFSMHGEYLARAQVKNISDLGLEIQVEKASIPDRCWVSIPQLSLENAHVRIVRTLPDNYGYGLEFTDLTTEHRRKITDFIYCRPGRWKNRYLPENTVVRALLRFFVRVSK